MDTTFAVHVDCDPLWVYEREYGISLADHDLIYTQALPDFVALCRELGIRATFFIIGRELERTACREFCRLALTEGHTLANHSYSHAVNFAALTNGERESEIRATHAKLTSLGATPKGYRSPGYFYCAAIGTTLGELGYRYDGSILPGPAALLMALYLRAQGQANNKSFGARANLFASSQVEDLGRGLKSVPVAVMPYLRMPVHTTFAYRFGRQYVDFGMALLRRKPGHHVLLFHAIDLLAVDGDPASPVIPLRVAPRARRDLVTDMLRRVRTQVVVTEEYLNA